MIKTKKRLILHTVEETLEADKLKEMFGGGGLWAIIDALQERAEALQEAQDDLKAIGGHSLKLENELNDTLYVLEKLGFKPEWTE